MERREMTFEEIGAEFGFTHQRAREVYNRAIYKLRKHLYEHPDLAADLRMTLTQDAEMPAGYTDPELFKLGWPDISNWSIQPVPHTHNWRYRTLKALENL